MKISAFLIIFTLFLFSSLAAGVQPIVSVVPSSYAVKVGDNITVNVSVDPGDNDTYGAQFDLNYTFPELNATSIVKGPFLTRDGASSFVIVNKCDNSISQCSFGESRFDVNSGVTIPGTLATINFKAYAVGVVHLDLTNVILSNKSAFQIENITISNATITVQPIFDTGTGSYPSIMGTHNGTIRLNQSSTVSKMYTYPNPGTGGHSEYAAFFYPNGSLVAEGYWSGYFGDWHNISFSPFVLEGGITYNYTIKTGSYTQIIHNRSFSSSMGTIVSTEFIDANGKNYSGWIPAIKLE